MQIANELASRMAAHTRMVQNMRDVLENDLLRENSSLSVPRCCTMDVSDQQYDVRFRNKVSRRLDILLSLFVR